MNLSAALTVDSPLTSLLSVLHVPLHPTLFLFPPSISAPKATGASELFKSLSSSYLDGLANDTLHDQRVNEHYASMPR